MTAIGRSLVAAVLASCLALPIVTRAQPAAARGAGEVLLERTLALVGGAVITQSDVDLATLLRLTDGAVEPVVGSPLPHLIARQLILHEVARFAPPDPSPAAMQARLDAIRTRAGSPEALAAALNRTGASMARLEGWVRDDLRMAAYIDQRFASAGTPTDADVEAYQRTHAEALRAAGVAPAALAAVARQRVIEERRRALVADWLGDLHRRTEVVEFKE